MQMRARTEAMSVCFTLSLQTGGGVILSNFEGFFFAYLLHETEKKRQKSATRRKGHSDIGRCRHCFAGTSFFFCFFFLLPSSLSLLSLSSGSVWILEGFGQRDK